MRSKFPNRSRRAISGLIASAGILGAIILGFVAGYGYITVSTQGISFHTTTADKTVTAAAATVVLSTTTTVTTSVVNNVTVTQTLTRTITSTVTNTSEIAALQSQLSSLSDRLNLKDAQQVSSGTVQCTEGQNCAVVTFSAPYPGYVVVSGTSTDGGTVVVTQDSGGGYGWNGAAQNLGTGPTSDAFPVTPGTITVFTQAGCHYFGFQCNSYSETLAVTYYS